MELLIYSNREGYPELTSGRKLHQFSQVFRAHLQKLLRIIITSVLKKEGLANMVLLLVSIFQLILFVLIFKYS